MFEKLFLLVKNNAGRAVINNSLIPQEYHEAVINEASSTIIEVLKGQMETGKMKELVKFFQFPGIYTNPLVNSIVNKFANKLNKFYGLEPDAALKTSGLLIKPVMEDLVNQTKNKQNHDFSLINFLNKLNGNIADIGGIVNRMTIA